MIKDYFYLGQILLGSLLLAGLLFTRRNKQASGFKLREADRLKDHIFSRFPGPVDLNAAKEHARAQRGRNARPKKPTLLLGGISIDGPAHEVLGVKVDASKAEVQKAWRELMKRYHPDKVGRPGSREWADAQRIAEAINGAKEEMVERRRKA